MPRSIFCKCFFVWVCACLWMSVCCVCETTCGHASVCSEKYPPGYTGLLHLSRYPIHSVVSFWCFAAFLCHPAVIWGLFHVFFNLCLAPLLLDSKNKNSLWARVTGYQWNRVLHTERLLTDWQRFYIKIHRNKAFHNFHIIQYDFDKKMIFTITVYSRLIRLHNCFSTQHLEKRNTLKKKHTLGNYPIFSDNNFRGE